jgi:hypothetical protein
MCDVRTLCLFSPLNPPSPVCQFQLPMTHHIDPLIPWVRHPTPTVHPLRARYHAYHDVHRSPASSHSSHRTRVMTSSPLLIPQARRQMPSLPSRWQGATTILPLPSHMGERNAPPLLSFYARHGTHDAPIVYSSPGESDRVGERILISSKAG